MTSAAPVPLAPPDPTPPTLAFATSVGGLDVAGAVADELANAFSENPNPRLRLTTAMVVVQHGDVVAEDYGPGTTALTRCLSWSTAKSVTHALIGCAVSDGLVELDAPAPVDMWRDTDDPRSAITLRQLLQMRSGLEFNEDYVDADASHCIEMLFGSGADDVAGYAATQRLLHPPGTVLNYSSGTTNIVVRILTDALAGRDEGIEEYARRRLFDPIGMTSAVMQFDAAGTFVGSSYLFATARDFARFGELYLRDGVWGGTRVLPEGWVDLARTPLSYSPEDGLYYGEHWWVWDDEYGTFAAQGYEGQYIVVVPALDAVIVRLGKTPIEHRDALRAHLRSIIEALAIGTDAS